MRRGGAVLRLPSSSASGPETQPADDQSQSGLRSLLRVTVALRPAPILKTAPILSTQTFSRSLTSLSTCRLNALMPSRVPAQSPKSERQIVGFSLSPEMARAVKAEAAQRGISLRKLFEELWSQYEKTKKARG